MTVTTSNDLDHTHDPDLRSWLDCANGDTPFPIQNLPLGAARFNLGDSLCVAIGSKVLPLAELFETGLLEAAGLPRTVFEQDCLNELMKMGPTASRLLRHCLVELLSESNAHYRSQIEPLLRDQSIVSHYLPVKVSEYTDFYAFIDHATNIGKLFRPDNPLLPNYRHIPIGYHGRTSSIAVSGTDVIRPQGQQKNANGSVFFGPEKLMDFETEIGAYIGTGTIPGDTIPLDAADQFVFGLTLLNDWSGRRIQAWEYQPLGPFLGKNFATTVSPWVITNDALIPFRCPRHKGEGQEVVPELPYLMSTKNEEAGGYSIDVSTQMSSALMRENKMPAVKVGNCNFDRMYWTVPQLVAHHASNGCPMNIGDLLGSGTISGKGPKAMGSMIEITRNGTVPFDLPDGSPRRGLEDGDMVEISARARAEGFRSIGFGPCSATIIGKG